MQSINFKTQNHLCFTFLVSHSWNLLKSTPKIPIQPSSIHSYMASPVLLLKIKRFGQGFLWDGELGSWCENFSKWSDLHGEAVCPWCIYLIFIPNFFLFGASQKGEKRLPRPQNQQTSFFQTLMNFFPLFLPSGCLRLTGKRTTDQRVFFID